MKYYLAVGYSELTKIVIGTHVYKFDKAKQVAGSWHATFATDDPECIAELDAAIGTQGIFPLTKAEHDALVKKKVSQPHHITKVTNPVDDMKPDPSAAKSVNVRRGEDSIAKTTVRPDVGATTAPSSSPAAAQTLDELTTTGAVTDAPTEGALSSQAALREALGLTISKFNTLNSKDGSPLKHEDGYHLDEWISHRDIYYPQG